MSEWFNDAFSKFGKVSGVTWIALGVVVALGLVVLAVSMSKKKWTAKMIAFGALAIALSFVLSCVRLYKMPTHGSITPGSMLPIMLFSVCYGIGPGMLAGLIRMQNWIEENTDRGDATSYSARQMLDIFLKKANIFKIKMLFIIFKLK